MNSIDAEMNLSAVVIFYCRLWNNWVLKTVVNWAGFELAIRRYEGHTTGRGEDGSFLIDGNPTTSFTFRQDYFFVMGDYRDNSEASRFWGFVPMDHIVGKAVLVYFSWNADAKLPRFSRLFKVID